MATPGGRDGGLLNCCSHFLFFFQLMAVGRFPTQPLPDEQMKNQILKVHTMNETLNAFQNISETNVSLWRSHLFLSSENILQFKYCESSILPVFPGTNLPCRVVADIETAIFYQSTSLSFKPSACKSKTTETFSPDSPPIMTFQPSCCHCRWFYRCRMLQTENLHRTSSCRSSPLSLHAGLCSGQLL